MRSTLTLGAAATLLAGHAFAQDSSSSDSSQWPTATLYLPMASGGNIGASVITAVRHDQDLNSS